MEVISHEYSGSVWHAYVKVRDEEEDVSKATVAVRDEVILHYGATGKLVGVSVADCAVTEPRAGNQFTHFPPSLGTHEKTTVLGEASFV